MKHEATARCHSFNFNLTDDRKETALNGERESDDQHDNQNRIVNQPPPYMESREGAVHLTVTQPIGLSEVDILEIRQQRSITVSVMIYVFSELFVMFLFDFWIYRIHFASRIVIPLLSNIYGPVLLVALLGNKEFRDSVCTLFSCCSNIIFKKP